MKDNRIEVLKNLSNEDYQSAPGIRASLVKSYDSRGSDYGFYMKNLSPNRPKMGSSLALDTGSAAHCLILEGEEAFERDFVVTSFKKGTLKYKELQESLKSVAQ